MITPGPGWYCYVYPHFPRAHADCVGPFDNPEDVFAYLAENAIRHDPKMKAPRVYTFLWNEMRDPFPCEYSPVAGAIHWRD